MSYSPGFKHTYSYAAGSDCVNRPVRRPMPSEYRAAVARDLSRSWLGVDEVKAQRIAYLPLMAVALDGIAALDVAQFWRKAA